MSDARTDERFVPGASRITEIESVHRYHVAAALCGGMRVLDAACGEGYGSDILARSAGDVTGIDLCAAAVETAAGKYVRGNLRFVAGDVLQMPFEDASFDRVVSFETIEHLEDPRRFLAEVRRVLKPDGLLVVTSPNKTPFDNRNCRDGRTNPHHVREMEAEEFAALLRECFPHVALYGQDAFYSSVVGGSGPMRFLVGDGAGNVLSHDGLKASQYSFALASAAECPALGASACVDARFDERLGYCLDDEAVVNQFGLWGEFKKACARIRELEERLQTQKVAFPMGHFYNPVPSDADIEKFIANRRYDVAMPGIDLNLSVQHAYYERLRAFHDGFVWKMERQEGLAYYGRNDQFALCCAYPVYAFMRLLRPKRIIEVGSGYSTAVMADTNRLYLDNSVKITCIEPYPTRLEETWGDRIEDHVTLHRSLLQDVDLSVFDQLEAGDICFIDSSHVAKLGSDVLRIFFELLPRLKPGVVIHFHDIPYPFEYYDYWLRENRAWNEVYMLRAFLQHNHDYEILFWGSSLVRLDESVKESDLGGSIWLRKNRTESA